MSLGRPVFLPSSSSQLSRALRVLAPAKLNLHLRVGPPRVDGFHPLLTWMCTASLFDTLKIEASPVEIVGERGEASPPNDFAGHGLTAPPLDGRNSTTAAPDDAAAGEAGAVILTCDLPGLPCDADNLVVRVARAWHQRLRLQRRQEELRHSGGDAEGGSGEACGAAEAAAAAMAARNAKGQAGRGVGRIAVALGKKIPVGAGLGGGSSDAARTLLTLDALDAPDRVTRATGRAAEDLSAFAARFGSDLSFFILGNGSAVCRGRGEQVTPIPPPSARWALLILPGEAMPTPAVYRKFDELRLGRRENVEDEPDWNAWVKMPAKYLLGCCVNDLEAPAFAISPSLGALRADAEQFFGRPVRMSGSGSSLFTLYDAQREAREAADLAAARFGQRVECVELAANFADDLNGFAA